jgi:two-component system cell cycle response regulator CpdR
MQKTPKKIRVLVVEDDPTFRSFWKRLFEQMDVHQYRIVSDPLKAMRLLDEESFTLLISDVVLPHINGYELAKYASRKRPGIEVVLTTAYSTDLSRFDLTGCKFHLLHKPYGNLIQVKTFILHLIRGEDVFEDASEDSFSENEDYPQITEWKL